LGKFVQRHLEHLEFREGPHGVTRSNHHGFEPNGNEIKPNGGCPQWGFNQGDQSKVV
jgi:hypothetical protein